MIAAVLSLLCPPGQAAEIYPERAQLRKVRAYPERAQLRKVRASQGRMPDNVRWR